MRKTKSRNVIAAVILLALTLVYGCDSHRLDQFADFASAGSQYVQNFHQITAQAGSAMIAIDSATLMVIRNIAVDTHRFTHRSPPAHAVAFPLLRGRSDRDRGG